MSTTATLTGNITITDNIATTGSLSKVLTALMNTGTTSEFVQSLILTAGANPITLPISPIQFLYLKNIHASNTVIVTWTPNGGASNVVLTLQPGSVIIFVETNATSGITALNLNASGTPTQIEMILAG
jgi:hypothetical protein